MGYFIVNTYGDQAVLKEYRNPGWFFSHLTAYCRVLGPLVMVAMWALTVTAFAGFLPVTGVYLLFLSILLIFQEFDWLFSRFSFMKGDNCIGMCWRGFVWFNDWKRSLEYLLLGIVAFIIGGFTSWPSFVGGALLLVLSVFYFLKAIRFTKIEPLRQAVDGGAPNPGFTGTATAPPTEWGTPGSKY